MSGMRLRKYGVQATIDFEVYDTDGVNLNATWVPAQADCEIMKDGGASTLCDNTVTDEGATFSIVLTATEMEFARGVLKIQDAATKVILDTIIHIETYGNASAQHAFDLDTASAAQTADNETRLATIETDTNEIQGKLPTNKFMGSSDGANDDGNIAAILTDTGTTLENRQVTIAGDVANIDGAAMTGTNNAALASVLGAAVGASISADIAAVKAETATIVTDTNELQGDWTNGGRLDLLLDAIKVVTDNQAAASTTLITGTVSWDNTNATTTVIYSDDVTEATADHYNGRLFVPTSGALVGQYTDITDYALDTGEGKFTVTAMTEPPADNTTFVIL